MKKLLLFIVLFTAVNTYSQARLGSKIETIETEFKNYPNTIVTRDYSTNGTLYLTVTKQNLYYVLYIFKNGRCRTTLLRPETLTILQIYIEKFNNKYVIINNTKWRYYTSNGIIEIQLLSTNDGIQYFKFISVN